jgi:hypothetical protein
MDDISAIEEKFQAISSRLDEAALRIWAAAEARSLGRGGVSAVAKAIGMSRTTIHAGIAEIAAGAPTTSTTNGKFIRVRAAGNLPDLSLSIFLRLNVEIA